MPMGDGEMAVMRCAMGDEGGDGYGDDYDDGVRWL